MIIEIYLIGFLITASIGGFIAKKLYTPEDDPYFLVAFASLIWPIAIPLLASVGLIVVLVIIIRFILKRIFDNSTS